MAALPPEVWRWLLAFGAVALVAAAALALWAIPRGRKPRASEPLAPYRPPLKSLYPHMTPLRDPAEVCSVCGKEIGPWWMWHRIHRNKAAYMHASCADSNGEPLGEEAPTSRRSSPAEAAPPKPRA